MTAMVFAAGKGTRLRPITNHLPKALVPYHGKPLLQHVLENLKAYGFSTIVINVHHFAQKIIDFLRQNHNFGLDIRISDETDELLDTGGGLLKAHHLLPHDEPILLHNVDILTELNLRQFYDSFNPEQAIAQLAVQRRFSSRVLIFSRQKGRLCGWRNKKTGEQIWATELCPEPIEMAFSGIHVVSPRIFDYLWAGKYSIIQAYLRIAGQEPIVFFDHTGQQWRDMGVPEAFVS